MKRNIDINEISDGRKYGSNDLVKVGCSDCEGCSACCCGMGESILLDPFDIWQLTTNLNRSFESLLQKEVELHVVDGLILPNLALNGEKESCHFLNQQGRCSIHAFRPGICRLFPLGRLYENETFCYILQKNECKKTNCSKVKIQKWIGIAEYKKYEEFVLRWHYFTKRLGEQMAEYSAEEKKKTSMALLQIFYMTPYQKEDFFGQFHERMQKVEEISG